MMGWLWVAKGWLWVVMGGSGLVMSGYEWFWVVICGYWYIIDIIDIIEFLWIIKVHLK